MKTLLHVLCGLTVSIAICIPESLLAMARRPVRNERNIALTRGNDGLYVVFGSKDPFNFEGPPDQFRGFILFARGLNYLETLLPDPANPGQPFKIPFTACRGGLTIYIEGLEGDDLIQIKDDDPVFSRNSFTESSERESLRGCRFVIFGGDGDDRIDGSGARDTIWGGNGNDHLQGGGGGDEIHGEAGDDFIAGCFETKSVGCGSGGSDIDTLIGGSGNDKLFGNY